MYDSKKIDIASLGEDFFRFVSENSLSDPSRLILQGGRDGFPLDFAVTQIECRRRCGGKFAGMDIPDRFLFADRHVSEMASRFEVARYNASVAGGPSCFADITAGTGMDFMAIASVSGEGIAVECDSLRADVLRHNLALYADVAKKARVICGDSVSWLEKLPEPLPLIYVDPARRDGVGRRVYGFRDSQPDIITLLPLLRSKAYRILVKGSPMIDIREALGELSYTECVHVVAYNGECKQILFDVAGGDSSPTENPKIVCVDLRRNGSSSFTIRLADVDNLARCRYVEHDSDVARGGYLCIPDATVMKTGCHSVVCDMFPGIRKLSANTHIYLSDTPLTGFPGRVVEIISLPGKSDLKAMRGDRINVISRNHPCKADELAARYRLIPGGERWLVACSARRNMLVECVDIYK